MSGDHPRIRGEHAAGAGDARALAGSSPHTRGARHERGQGGVGAGIIPAYAGSTARGRQYPSARTDHPRIRGEHSAYHSPNENLTGSSPHTRGAPVVGWPGWSRGGIIPAYAGSTPGSGTIAGSSQDHPRIRGEHAPGRPGPRGRLGSSPHTRGARINDIFRMKNEGIIPAYAGSTAPSSPACRWRWDHPRIRGEHAKTGKSFIGYGGSSPHTRGALSVGTPDSLLGGIIPAYAGSTSTTSSSAVMAGDHPRIRGEHSPTRG